MSTLIVHRPATPDEIVAEMDRRGVVIERLEVNLRHWREECGKLQSQLDREKEKLSVLNTGGLTLLYDIRRELGWNDKTALNILPSGVRRVCLALGGQPGEDLEALARSVKSAVISNSDLIAALRRAHEFVAMNLDELLASCCVTGDDGKPDRSTIDHMDKAAIDDAEEALAQIDAALAKANP